MNYTLSPEFHRHLWTRFSAFRLVAPPLAVGLLFAVAVYVRGINALPMAFDVSMSMFYIVAVLWGNYEAATALRDEVRSNTWDFQRMSAITPGKLGFGKLFGVTSYVWYVAAWPMLVAAVSALLRQDGGTMLPQALSAGHTLQLLFFMVMAGVLGHAAALLLAFRGLSSSDGQLLRGRVPAMIPALLAGVIVSHIAYTFCVGGMLVEAPTGTSLMQALTPLKWYGQNFQAISFFTVSALFFLFWFGVGIYRSAREELMYRCTPSGIVLGALAVGLFLLGLSPPQSPWAYGAGLFIWLASIAYLCMLGDAMDLRRLGRLRTALAARSFSTVLENTPRWLALLVVALAVYICALTKLPASGFAEHKWVIGVAVLLFLLRDAAVMYGLTAYGRGRAVMFERVFFLIMAYALLPLIHVTLLGNQTAIAPTSLLDSMPVYKQASAIYYPTPYAPATSLLPVLGQLVAVAAFIWWRISKSRHAEKGTKPAVQA